MKTTEFLNENEMIGLDAHGMHKDHQHQMLREECYHLAVNSVALHKLLSALPDGQPLDAWAAEKISIANDYIKTVKEWLEYDVMGSEGNEIPGFDAEQAETQFYESLGEDATGGASMSSTVAVTPQSLGEKGSYTKKQVNKKLGSYTNMMTRGGPVKVGK
jgi:hypothetical protein